MACMWWNLLNLREKSKDKIKELKQKLNQTSDLSEYKKIEQQLKHLESPVIFCSRKTVTHYCIFKYASMLGY